ncbi:hypothetical protein MANES_11G126577v8 [Manihot esculenta]|uniref:Uncharacterized protein n=1 Tax=Manihot esculenta TaxID=3983 RepID=A0ACB7GVL1_MANES|nr:hypothetical protein MANES_11G126577v8 [Manihot esculenta]
MAGTPLLLVVLQGSFSSKMPRPSIKYLLIFLQCSYRRTSVSSAELNDMPDVMKQMPPLPFKLNEKLANTMLPYRPNLPMK